MLSFMQIQDTLIDLFGNHYLLTDYHIAGEEYPLYTNNEVILTRDIVSNHTLIIEKNSKITTYGVIYNSYLHIYILLSLSYIKYDSLKDIRKHGKKSTKNIGINTDDGPIPHSNRKHKRRI